MKALNVIYLPRVAKTDDFTSVQTEERNQNNMQQNFRMIAVAVNALEESVKNMPDEILAKVIAPDVYVQESNSDGIWDWLKWSDGKINALGKTAATAVSCNTAAGAIYKGELTVSLPTSLFTTISSVLLTPICSANIVWATVKSVSATEIAIYVLTTASASITAEFSIQVYGE